MTDILIAVAGSVGLVAAAVAGIVIFEVSTSRLIAWWDDRADRRAR